MRPRVVDYLNRLTGTELFAFLVPGPAILYALSMAVVMVAFVKRTDAAGLPRFHALGAAIWAMIAGLVGARALYLLLNLGATVRDPGRIVSLAGGTISWGAYLGGLTAFILYLRRNDQPVGRYADVLGSVLGLGPFIARFACLMNGDDYGRLGDVAWAIRYPPGSYPYQAQLRDGLIDSSAQLSLPVHPVQVYLALVGLALFLVLSRIVKARAMPSGGVFLLYWALYGAARFVLEFWRGHGNRAFIGPLPDGQAISGLVALLASAALALLLFRRGLALRSRDSLIET